MRLVGGTLAGTAADKWGRKLPLMLSVLWFSLFAFLSGFAPSYAVLFGNPGAVRSRHGWRVGGRHAARPRTLASPAARARLGTDAGRLVLGISLRRRGVSVHLSAFQRHARPRLASHVLGMRHPRVVHVLDSRARSRESRMARTAAPLEGDRRRRTRAEALSLTDFSARHDQHDDSNDAGHRIVHVHLLLAELLVSDGAARRGTDEPAAVPRGVQRRRDPRHSHVGTIVRRTTGTPRCVYRDADSRAGVVAVLPLRRHHARARSSAR